MTLQTLLTRRSKLTGQMKAFAYDTKRYYEGKRPDLGREAHKNLINIMEEMETLDRIIDREKSILTKI